MDINAVERYFAVFGKVSSVGKSGGVLRDPDPAIPFRREGVAECPVLTRDPEIEIRASLVVHVPEIRADGHGHPAPVPGVVGTTLGITARHAEVIADHFLVGFKTSGTESYRLFCLNVYLLAFIFRDHSPDLSGFNVPDQFLSRHLILNPDISFEGVFHEQKPEPLISVAEGGPADVSGAAREFRVFALCWYRPHIRAHFCKPFRYMNGVFVDDLCDVVRNRIPVAHRILIFDALVKIGRTPVTLPAYARVASGMRFRCLFQYKDIRSLIPRGYGSHETCAAYAENDDIGLL